MKDFARSALSPVFPATPVLLASVIALVSIGGIACNQNSGSQKEQQTNDKRWENFQKDNQGAASQAQTSFEKRQAELAEKRRKADAGKKDDKKASPPTTAPASGTTP